MPTRKLLPLALISLAIIPFVFLTACGGGSNGGAANPIFTSEPPTAATQSVLYTYQIAATDPAGGTVSFSLTTGPSGASLSGSTLNWTPTAPQSRVPDSFTVTATTTSGGSASQTWTVSPNGTITVNWVDTNWTENGPVQTPINGSLGLFALVPQPDGSLLALQGSFISPGVVNILNVPAGYFWLSRGPMQSNGIWTSSSTIDVGQDLLGAPFAGPTSTNTVFDFNLTGLASVPQLGVLGGFTDETQTLGILSVPPGSTTLTATETFLQGPDWSKIDTVFLMQYEPALLGATMNTLVLGPALTLSNLTLTNGTTNNITGMLLPTPEASMTLSVPGSQWAAFVQQRRSVSSDCPGIVALGFRRAIHQRPERHGQPLWT